jgi:prevent-host-death family protein
MTKSFTSREFNQDVSRAKREAAQGPVFITDRGEPAHVLMTINEYRRLTGAGRSIAEALGDPEAAEIDFDPPRFDDLPRSVDFDD